jgi:CubicO group peptidase (beta-lactamase class C family)
VATVPDSVVDVSEQLFADGAPHGRSLALVVQHHGAIVHERYGAQPDTLFGPGGPVDASTTLISWSMAKSITQAAVGIAVADGLLELDAPAPVPAWRGTDKEQIRLVDLLEMRSGLEFVEDYVDDAVSHCLEMLYGSGNTDMAAYAASQQLLHRPGEVWNYSSGTTNIVSRIVTDAILRGATPADGGRAAMELFLAERLFEPAGMTSAIPKFDDAGTFIGSSYVYATARDFVRFGRMYLDDGVVDGVRVLPAGWRDVASTWSATDPEGSFDYGRHWWLWRTHPGTFGCHGYEGQFTIIAPDRDLVLVHLGKCPSDLQPPLVEALVRLIDAFPTA